MQPSSTQDLDGPALSVAAAGVTLVETLVAISLIAILMALLVPALAESKRAARQAGCISNVRQSGLDMLTYASSHSDFMPAPKRWDIDPSTNWWGFDGQPAPAILIGYVRHGDLIATEGYIHWSPKWPLILAADGAAGGAAWTCAGHSDDHAPVSSEDRPWIDVMGAATPLKTAFWYSSAFLADPKFFRDMANGSFQDFGPQRLADVLLSGRPSP